MRLRYLLFPCVAAVTMAQGWGKREAMRPWLEGRFLEADQQFARMRSLVPPMAMLTLWQADFEIERGNYGAAGDLIKEAQRIQTPETRVGLEMRRARLLMNTGRFADAEQLLLGGRTWDRKNIGDLKVNTAMDLNTLGEIEFFRGNYSTAIAVLDKAAHRAKNVSSLDGAEWMRAQQDIALADIESGSTSAAAEIAAKAFSAAEHEWGPSSVPAMDALDLLGLAQLAAGDLSNADVSLTRSRKWREMTYGLDHLKVAESYMHAAALLSAQGDHSKAVTVVAQSMQIEKAKAVGPNGRWALAMLAAAQVLAKAGQFADAKESYENALPVLEMELGQEAPRVQRARTELKALP
ncbi:MAG TPA: tetratricopeptide repeat protein [Bryobacteraceae bacterium]|nr:tetratricopeptide repeat protein [Bryobacteraceae bacterium]